MNQESTGITRTGVPFTMIANHIVDDESLSANELLTSLALCRFANAESVSWPSMKTIAAKARISRRSVIYALKELEKKGHIEKQIRLVPGKKSHASNIYVVIDDKLRRPKNEGVVQEVHQGGAGDAPGVVQEVHPNYIYIEQDTQNNVAAGAAKDGKSLHKRIQEAFETARGEPFEHQAKENKHIQLLIKQAEKEAPDDIECWLQRWVEFFWHNKYKSGDSFWRKQPFLPSRLYSLLPDMKEAMKTWLKSLEECEMMSSAGGEDIWGDRIL